MKDWVMFWYSAWSNAALGVCNSLDNIPLNFICRHQELKPVHSMIMANKITAELSRYRNGDYEVQQIVRDHRRESYFTDEDVMGMIKAESAEIWR